MHQYMRKYSTKQQGFVDTQSSKSIRHNSLTWSLAHASQELQKNLGWKYCRLIAWTLL